MDLIYGQGNPPYGQMPYGNSTVGPCGCGAVAICNALATLGDERYTLEQITEYLENGKYLSFGGKMGTKKRGVIRFLREAGYGVSLCRRRRRYGACARQAAVCILVYAFARRGADRRLHFGAHYVMLHQEGERGIYCNVGMRDSEPTVFYGEPAAFLKQQGAVRARCILISRSPQKRSG